MIWSQVLFRYEFSILSVIIFTFSLWLTFYFRWIQYRYFKHAWCILFSRYNEVLDSGEISQTEALTLGLSGTIGIANIALVSTAIIGAGPGIVFWLLCSAFLGMCIKFIEATLGQKYRYIKNSQYYIGGPMVTFQNLLTYNNEGSSKFNRYKNISIQFISQLYAISLVGIIIIFGNIFQVSQAMDIITNHYQIIEVYYDYIPYLLCALLVGLIWKGKYNRLAYFLAKVLPFILLIYILFSVTIILQHLDRIMDILILIIRDAFGTNHDWSTRILVFVVGTMMGMISHESGLGISSIAHASAQTRHPIRQGLVAMIEPFIDTICISFTTAMVLLLAIDQGFIPDGYSSINIKNAYLFFIPWFGPLFNGLVLLLTLACLVSSYFYIAKLMNYLFKIKISIYTLCLFCILILITPMIELSWTIPFIKVIAPLVIIPNLISLLVNAKKIKQDLLAYLSNLEDGFGR